MATERNPPAAGRHGAPKCGRCSVILTWVGSGPSFLNGDQWDAEKAGEYFLPANACDQDCPGRLHPNGNRYWGEIAPEPPAPPPTATEALTALEQFEGEVEVLFNWATNDGHAYVSFRRGAQLGYRAPWWADAADAVARNWWNGAVKNGVSWTKAPTPAHVLALAMELEEHFREHVAEQERLKSGSAPSPG